MTSRALRSGLHATMLALVVSGCASSQATMTTKVKRAPWISFHGHSSVRTQFEAACQAERYGPEESASRSLVQRQTDCIQSARGVGAAIEREAQSMLRRGGYQVGAGTPLVGTIAIRMQTKVEPVTRKDTPQSTTCQKVCGRPTCLLPRAAGVLEVKATFSGPRGRAAGIDKVDRVIAVEAPLRAQQGNQGVVCSLGDAHRWHQPDRFDWTKAEREVVDWYRGTFQRMLLPYVEDFELGLFELETPAEATRALASARAKRWKEALEDYRVSLQLALDANDRQSVPRIRHNLAISLMELGLLEEALEEARRAKAEGQSDDPEELVEEIQRRIADKAKTS